MKLLVLGAGGMAGHVVATYLKENGYSADTLSKKNKVDDGTALVDVTDIATLKAFLKDKSYDVVINCIGLLVKPSEEHKDLAIYLNSYLPHFLEEHYINGPTKIIHLSTNAVFSSKNSPLKENSSYDAGHFYGRTKALGEIINNKDLTFRMSIIGPELDKDGSGLFNWFFGQHGTVSGYTDAMWNGLTTLELAKAIKAAIEQNLTGIYHLVSQDNISKFDLLQLIKKVFERDNITINPAKSASVDYPILFNSREDFNYHVADYTRMFNDLNKWIENHSELYPQYEQK
jgi:dTDP-4-dehydrorhamnose reductase